MFKSKFLTIFVLISLISIAIFYYFKLTNKKETQITHQNQTNKETENDADLNFKSNVIQDINYTTTDGDGNEYIVKAIEGEIDIENPNIIYLTMVTALIKLKNLNEIIITSSYGKYNIDNFDTIFSKNVMINYLENNITSEYLDFSLERNSMIISKEVVYNNSENIMKADVIEINLKTKDTKIFMYEEEEKINIKSKKQNGNN